MANVQLKLVLPQLMGEAHLESVLQLEPQAVGVRWYYWVGPPGSHGGGSGSRSAGHPHHWGIVGGGHPLRTNVATHG